MEASSMNDGFSIAMFDYRRLSWFITLLTRVNVVIMYTTVFINQFIVHFFISLASHFAGPSCEFPL